MPSVRSLAKPGRVCTATCSRSSHRRPDNRSAQKGPADYIGMMGSQHYRQPLASLDASARRHAAVTAATTGGHTTDEHMRSQVCSASQVFSDKSASLHAGLQQPYRREDSCSRPQATLNTTTTSQHIRWACSKHEAACKESPVPTWAPPHVSPPLLTPAPPPPPTHGVR
jgi:hypothetical protein